MDTHAPTSHEWALPHFRQVRALRLVALGIGLSLALALAPERPSQILQEPWFVLGVTALCLVTTLTWLRAFARFEPWLMTIVPVLDLAVIGVFGLIPGVSTGAVVIAVLLPSMWLGGTLGRPGILVAAAASSALTVAPDLYLHGVPREGGSDAVTVITCAALAATAMALSTEIWKKQVLRLDEQELTLRRAIAVKDDFVALVSHELRTPLTSILGYLDLVTDCDGDLSPQAVTHLAAVTRNAERLLLLVTDLLSAHETTARPMCLTIETVDVSGLVGLGVDDIETRALENGLTVERDLPAGIEIPADPNRVLQITDNLLSNALKHTPPGGSVSVTVRRRGTGADVTVTDTGMGVDPVSLQSLGTKFFRSPRTTASGIPGIGLGLTITRSIVEAHHGTLSFTSREGEGTSVLVHLPGQGPSMHVPAWTADGSATDEPVASSA